MQNVPSTPSGTMAVPGTIRPATAGTIDVNGRTAPHGYAVMYPFAAGLTDVTLTTTAVASAATSGSMVSVHPPPSATCAVPTPYRVSTSRTGVSGVKRLAAGLAPAPATVVVLRPAHGSLGEGFGGGGGGTAPRTWNHVDFRPSRDRNVSPEMLTEPADPFSVIVRTRPPQSPLPSRVSITMDE